MLKLCVLLFSIGMLINCSSTEPKSALEEKASIRQQLAQKIILDFRYFCSESNLKSNCVTPMRQLPASLADLISSSNLGGVILFSENLDTVEQIVTLNHQITNAGANASLGLPLFIAVDQEGGRVARLPRDRSTPFTGSLSIAATFPKHGVKYAKQSGEIIGKELVATGFNLNFAPTADVNVNPANPVINVRSFGEDPATVSLLASAQLKAMQQQPLLGTLKHFPGHGDTSVDSHTGLPRVDHSLNQIQQVDLAPFQYAIDEGTVSVIMTAHIQFPELDNSTFVSKDGRQMIKPATMSKTILTDLLRGQMNYQGLIVTDALDMRGISKFFTQTEAVIETFNAGADIALMPISIRNSADITKFDVLLDELELAVNQGRIDREQLQQSYQRIKAVKQNNLATEQSRASLDNKIQRAITTLSDPKAKQIQAEIAEASITLLQGEGKLSDDVTSLFAIMPDANKCLAFVNALNKQEKTLDVSCMNYLSYDHERALQHITNSDALLVASINPKQSIVEMGAMEDWPKLRAQLKKQRLPMRKRTKVFTSLLKAAKAQQKQTLFVSLRMPYESVRYADYADEMLATYAYNQHMSSNGEVTGVVYDTIAKVLTGRLTPQGQLPVSVK